MHFTFLKSFGLSTALVLLALILWALTGAPRAETAQIETPQTGTLTGGVTHSMLPWFKSSFLDIADDVDEARENSKHVLLFFHLASCPYCAKMVAEFDKSPLKNFIQQNFDVIAINIKGDKEVAISAAQTLSEKALAQQIKVQYTPTMVFLNHDNQVVARTNGYRSPAQLQKILDYISRKIYLNLTLAEYIARTTDADNYQLQNNASFQNLSDLSQLKTPLAVIFEDKSCDACRVFHQTTLKNTQVKNAFKAFDVVRFDAHSTEPIIDNMGRKTTPKEWAKRLNLTYRPGIILFDKGREITRIDGLLYRFHFQEVLRYVSGRFYQTFATYNAYLAHRSKTLLEQGVNIDISQ